MEEAVTKSGFPPLPFEGPGTDLRVPHGPQGQRGLCIPVSLSPSGVTSPDVCLWLSLPSKTTQELPTS